MTVPPELVERFRVDLAAIWPLAGEDWAKLGLAISGGGDSLGLLLLAHAALPCRIEAATIDHGLRAESADEARHVGELCDALDVPHTIATVTVGPGNLQAQARKARYSALSSWCEARGLKALATAHQLDDQAETVLMRLNRGSGLSGLAAIRASAPIPHATGILLRPLLGWRRAELAEIVRAAGWRALQDPSNEDRAFDRVRIRKALAEADWIDPVSIARSAGLLGQAHDALDWAIARILDERVEFNDRETTYRPMGEAGSGEIELHAGIVQRIFERLGSAIQLSAAMDVVIALRSGAKRNVAGIQAWVASDGQGIIWVFARENPRRAA